jgi:hypothetical protein
MPVERSNCAELGKSARWGMSVLHMEMLFDKNLSHKITSELITDQHKAAAGDHHIGGIGML